MALFGGRPSLPSLMLLQENGHTNATLGEWLGYAEAIGVKENTPEFARMPHSSIFSKGCGYEHSFSSLSIICPFLGQIGVFTSYGL